MRVALMKRNGRHDSRCLEPDFRNHTILPFNPNEQAVICHKKLLALKDELIEPVRLKDTTSLSTIGDVRLKILQDAGICQQIAKENYAPDLGAQSLHCGIDSVRVFSRSIWRLMSLSRRDVLWITWSLTSRPRRSL